MKASVLIIEDIREMADLIKLYLEKEGIETEIRESAEESIELLATRPFDLLVLDLNLPGMDGFQFLQWFRKDHDTPVIIVSARDEDEDIVMGLGIGADEFVTKPFSPKVLAARVRALLRRSVGMQTRKVVRFGGYSLDLESRLLKKGEERISLSEKEFEVLAFLISSPGKPFTPEAIYEAVWKLRYGDFTGVAVYIQRIRKKIEDDPSAPCFIETVHGMGYRFNADRLDALKGIGP
jgi:two-component system response regulator RegX3